MSEVLAPMSVLEHSTTNQELVCEHFLYYTIYFHLEFTHVPPSRYLFSGAIVDSSGDSSAPDTSDTSSSSGDVLSSSNCGGPNVCKNSGQLDPDTKGCDGTVLEHTSSQPQDSPHQKNTDMKSDSAPPKTHEASLADSTGGENNTTKHDSNKKIHEPPQLCGPPSKRANLELV